jgi:hypothetical protein
MDTATNKLLQLAVDAISLLSLSRAADLKLYRINKQKALGSLLLDAVGATLSTLEEAEKLGKRVETHLKGVAQHVARVNRSHDEKLRAARSGDASPCKLTALEASRAEALKAIDESEYPGVASTKVVEAQAQLAEVEAEAAHRSERIARQWADAEEARARNYGVSELKAELMHTAKQLIDMSGPWADEEAEQHAHADLREFADAHISMAVNTYLWGRDSAAVEAVAAHLQESKAHQTTLHWLLDTKKELLDMSMAHAALTEQHDDLVDENHDLQMQILRLQERLERAEHGSSSPSNAPESAGVQESRVGAREAHKSA